VNDVFPVPVSGELLFRPGFLRISYLATILRCEFWSWSYAMPIARVWVKEWLELSDRYKWDTPLTIVDNLVIGLSRMSRAEQGAVKGSAEVVPTFRDFSIFIFPHLRTINNKSHQNHPNC
jgi:hypothetical protein